MTSDDLSRGHNANFIGSINNSLIVHDPECPNDLNRLDAF